MIKKIICNLLIIFIFISIDLSADYTQLPGFPFAKAIPSLSCESDGVGLINLNDDEYLEIVVSLSDSVFAIDYQGNKMWSIFTPRDARGTMSFADVNNDGYLEILQATRSGWIYILDRYGNNIEGWPKYYGNQTPWYSYKITTPVAYDLDEDGLKEIVWGDYSTIYESNLYVVNLQGEHFNDGFPFTVEPGVAGTPTIADVNNDGMVEIVCMGYSEIYVMNTNGEVINGWPQQPFEGESKYFNTSPVVVDLTGDGFLEIIVAASGHLDQGRTPSGIIVYKYDGSILTGWPQNVEYVLYCPITIADLDNNGSLDIICGRKDPYSIGNFLYVFHNDGQPFTGSPYYSFGEILGPIIAGNIDSTPEKELIFDSNLVQASNNLGYIQGLTCYGDTIPGFPLRPKGCTMRNSGVFGDINQDGILDLINYSTNFIDSIWIYAYDLYVPYDPLQIEWKTYQYDFRRSGIYHSPYSFDPPINFNALVDSHGVNLTWEQPANERNYAYAIFRDDAFLARTPYTSYCDSIVQSYTTYEYYIKSVYEQGFSPPSNIIEVTTDSISIDSEMPVAVTSSVYPNPFSNSTTILFELKSKPLNSSEIKIYNVKGQLVRELPAFPSRGLGTSGVYEVVWDGCDEYSIEVGTGVYFYKFAGNDKYIGKIVKLR